MEPVPFHVALWEPEIPPNTGNIARLCAATGAELHLIGRLGFRLDDRSLRRAGLDYWDKVTVHRHASFPEFETFWSVSGGDPGRIFGFSTKGTVLYSRITYRPGDCLLL